MMNELRKIGLVSLVLLTGVSSGHAVPVGTSNRSDGYLMGTGLPRSLAAGLFLRDTEREVEFLGVDMPLSSTVANAYLGIDLFRWLTLYGTVGTGSHDLGDVASSDGNMNFEVGLSLSLVDHIIPDPTLFEDRIRVVVAGSYGRGRATWLDEKYGWSEWMLSGTVSIVNDLAANKLFNPNSIALYVGPVYSAIQSGEDAIRGQGAFGYQAGLEIFLTESVSMDVGMLNLKGSGWSAGLHVKF